MPGGANGVALKLNSPNTYAYADNFGFTLADRNMLIVMLAWSKSLSHSARGKSGLHVANPALKCFLKVWIALSARLAL